ncbi:MAG: EamA family transporter [Bacteroidales bacterium]|nr:EamA family transporter [Bacteroidales bacterium]
MIKKLGTIRSSNYIYLNPVFTLAGSLIFLNEQMNWLSLLGSLITLLGVWQASRK